MQYIINSKDAQKLAIKQLSILQLKQDKLINEYIESIKNEYGWFQRMKEIITGKPFVRTTEEATEIFNNRVANVLDNTEVFSVKYKFEYEIVTMTKLRDLDTSAIEKVILEPYEHTWLYKEF